MTREKIKNTSLILRLSEIEKTKWQTAAAERGMGTSEYIRFCVNKNIENMENIKKEEG